MKLTVKLPNDLDSCPTAWQIMIYSLIDKEIPGYDNNGMVRDREINKVLSKFKATYIDDDPDSRIEFEDGKYHTFYILTYEKRVDGH